MDPREREDMRVDDDDRSQDSIEFEKKQKLGNISTDDEDMTENFIGSKIEITHDGKVNKEILACGDGQKMRMGYKCWIKYKAYFFKDHLIFDESERAELCLGDNTWPDGLQTGVEKMRKGETAKIYIKKIHGFGRPLKVEILNFPKDYQDGPNRERIIKEQIIYEVELLDFQVREDVEANGIFLKYPEIDEEGHEWETPKNED